METGLLYEIVVLFLLSIGVTLLCNRIKLPATVGFLLTGALCGPSLLGVVSNTQTIGSIAEIGVAMLLFTIGMELSGEALNRLKRPVFLGGSLQIGLTVLAITGLYVLQGHPWQGGVLWGCLVALSSSAIVLQILQSHAATSTPSGRLSLAILVFQDIMVAPMLLAVPLLAGTLNLSWDQALLAVGKVALALGGVILAAHFGLDRLMEAVMRTRTREILLLTTLGLCMGMALLTSALGLSLSLGAFLAGLLLARSQYSMSVIAGILPYRDVFMSLFFISVGMMLNVDFFLAHIWKICIITALFVVIKTLLSLPAVLVQGYPLKTAIITSLSLAQVGEFSFVLAANGLHAGLFDNDSYQIFLAVSVITMMLTPGLIAVAPALSDKICGRKDSPESETDNSGQDSLAAMEDHLIIVGFGISGKHLAHVARQSGITYNILEMNPETVHRYQGKEPITHGDASQPVILEHLGIKRARVMAIVISDPVAVRAITIEAHKLNPNLFVVARTRFVTEIAPLKRLGANAVISEEFESSIEVFSTVLTQYFIPRQDIDAFIAHIRQKNYRTLRRMANAVGTLDNIINRLPDMGVQAMRIMPGSPLCGKTLAQSGLRPTYGVTVIAVQHEKQVNTSVTAQTLLQSDDILYLFANAEKLYAVAPVFSEAREAGAGGENPQPA